MSKVKINLMRGILTVCFMLCILFGLAACGGEKTLDIVDWENESLEVTLGDSYTVPQKTARDKEGKSYPVEIKVLKKATGTEIPLIYGAFDVFDVSGYDVLYTA